MSITIELPADTLAALRADASAQGRSVEQIVAEQISALYTEQEDMITSVNEALDEMDAGKSRPFAEFATEFDARFAARFGAK